METIPLIRRCAPPSAPRGRLKKCRLRLDLKWKNTKNQELTAISQMLRRNMTKEERHLWYDFLKSQTVVFKRQKVIGRYIVDIFCADAMLVIELDGSQHYSADGRQADALRDDYLKSRGLTVVRYSNLEVTQNFEGVCTDILRRIGR